MKAIMFVMILFFGVSSATAELIRPIVEDNFNSYTNGSIVGQGNWTNHNNGNNFIVQGNTVFEGSNALYNNSLGDSTIRYYRGENLLAGKQVFYIKTENRNSWSSSELRLYLFGNTNGGNIYGAYADVVFTQDGRAFYFNDLNNGYNTFDTYEDNTWTLLEIQWNTDYSNVDGRGRVHYTLNGGATRSAWAHNHGWLGLGQIDIRFNNMGSGGVYIDTLGAEPIPEPSTIVLIITGLIAFYFFRRKK